MGDEYALWGFKGVNPPTVFPAIKVDTKGGGGGTNHGRLVNGKRFLLKNCLVLVGFAVSVKDKQFPLREALMVALDDYFWKRCS